MWYSKVSKSQKKYGVLDSSKKWTKLTILSTEVAQDSEFCSFFGRIQDAIICFRDLLTFSTHGNVVSDGVDWHHITKLEMNGFIEKSY